MKKTLVWLLVALLLCTASVTTVLAASDVVGEYYLVGMFDGVTDPAEATRELYYLACSGNSSTIVAREDGSATLNLFGQEKQIRFDADEGIVRTGGNDLSYYLEDGVLTIGKGSESMVFRRGAPTGLEAFDYYVLEKLLDESGEEIDVAEMPMTLSLYAAGDGIVSAREDALPITLDYEKMELREDGYPAGTFAIEGDVVTLNAENGRVYTFRRSDPPMVGAYILIPGADEEDLGSLVRKLSMVPNLTIGEDGSAKIIWNI